MLELVKRDLLGDTVLLKSPGVAHDVEEKDDDRLHAVAYKRRCELGELVRHLVPVLFRCGEPPPDKFLVHSPCLLYLHSVPSSVKWREHMENGNGTHGTITVKEAAERLG